jgi:hypothetical protein
LHGIPVILRNRDAYRMTVMRGNVAAYRFDEAGPQASPSTVARNKQQTHKPDAVFGVVSNHIGHGADFFVPAEDAVDEFVVIGFPGASSVRRL